MAYLDRSWSPPPQVGSNPRRNISETERWVSAVAGAALGAWALERRWPATRGCSARSARRCSIAPARHIARRTPQPGISTAETDTKQRPLGVRAACIVESEVTVNRPVARALCRFWRTLDNLPRVMEHLQSVTVLDNRRSRWVAQCAARQRRSSGKPKSSTTCPTR